jgi:hypothetical protein
MAGYSSTPLARKLDVVAGVTVLLDGAPPTFTLGDLPSDVTVHRRAGRTPYDVILCFGPTTARLLTRWPVLHPRTTTEPEAARCRPVRSTPPASRPSSSTRTARF